jgi:DNA-binding MurR/RpiR family transcriptional regulator
MTRIERNIADYLLKDYREELKHRYNKLAARVFKAVKDGI